MGVEDEQGVVGIFCRLVELAWVLRGLGKREHGNLPAFAQGVGGGKITAHGVDDHRLPVPLVKRLEIDAVGDIAFQQGHVYGLRQLLQIEARYAQQSLVGGVDGIQRIGEQKRALAPVKHLIANLHVEVVAKGLEFSRRKVVEYGKAHARPALTRLGILAARRLQGGVGVLFGEVVIDAIEIAHRAHEQIGVEYLCRKIGGELGGGVADIVFVEIQIAVIAVGRQRAGLLQKIGIGADGIWIGWVGAIGGRARAGARAGIAAIGLRLAGRVVGRRRLRLAHTGAGVAEQARIIAFADEPRVAILHAHQRTGREQVIYLDRRAGERELESRRRLRQRNSSQQQQWAAADCHNLDRCFF